MKLSARNLLLGLMILGLLLGTHFVTPSSGGLWLRTFYDSLHVPVFGAIAVGILSMTPVTWDGRRRFVVSLAAVALLAGVSELAQVPTARDASLRDFASDVLGGIGFMCIAVGLSRTLTLQWERRLCLALVGTAAIAIPLTQLVVVSASYVARAQVLPSLIQFDSRYCDLLFELQGAKLIKTREPTTDGVSAVILLDDVQWPGISFTDVWPDWEAYEALVIEIENPDVTNLPIAIRIHDRRHRDNQEYDDRFNRSLSLVPGRQSIRIGLEEVREAPVGRKMNMKEIDGLVLFAARDQAGRQFILHDLRLVEGGSANDPD